MYCLLPATATKRIICTKMITVQNLSANTKLSWLRKGVETILSKLHRKYDTGQTPIRETLLTKYCYRFKIATLNFRIFKY